MQIAMNVYIQHMPFICLILIYCGTNNVEKGVYFIKNFLQEGENEEQSMKWEFSDRHSEKFKIIPSGSMQKNSSNYKH